MSSTLFLRVVIYLFGLAVLGLCVIVLGNAFFNPSVGYYFPILIGVTVSAIPFFVALYQGLLLLHYIDRNTAFSQKSVSAVSLIMYCAFALSTMYAAGMPYIIWAADKDDAPGVVLVALICVGTTLVVGVFAAVLKKLLQNAIDIKSENDLTV